MAALDYSDLIPSDILQGLNETSEFKCLLAAHFEKHNEVKFGNIHFLVHKFMNILQEDEEKYCPTAFDSILCWPKTLRGTLAYLPCLEEFKGVHYDVTSEYSPSRFGSHQINETLSESRISQKMHHAFAIPMAIGTITPIIIYVSTYPIRQSCPSLSLVSNYQPSFTILDIR